MNVLSIYASTNSLGDCFRENGANVYDIHWGEDVLALDVSKTPFLKTIDVIVVQPLCKTYSIAGIKSHRRKNLKNGNLDPISDLAKFSDEVNIYILKLIREIKPKLWIIENPMGGLRKMSFMNKFMIEEELLRHEIERYTITYFKYGDTRMKPTDIWMNKNNVYFKPRCKNGDPCHEPSPRGSRTGTQGRKLKSDKARIPKELCEYLYRIAKEVNHE